MRPSMSKTLKIRRASENDIPTILACIRGLAEYEKLAHEVVATEADLKKTLFGDRAYAEVLLGFEGQKPVGFCLFFHNYSTFLAKPGIYLEDLFVFEEFRGSGYGKQLLLELVKIAERRGCGRVEWQALDWNTPAHDFYENLGAFKQAEWLPFRQTEDKIHGLANQA